MLIVVAVFLISVVTVECERDHTGRSDSYILTFLDAGTEMVSPCSVVAPDIILNAVPGLLTALPATEPVSKWFLFPHYFRGPPLKIL